MSLLLAIVLSTGLAYAMDKIDINTATKSELQALSGVGEATADAIIQYREENGIFKSEEDLVNVKVIGSMKVERFTDSVTVSKLE
jgi:competence protein ComEA